MATFLKVVKAGDPEPDSEILEMKRSAAERLLASGDCPFFLHLEEADEAIVTFGGDMLEMSATVEEVARGAKRRALGRPE